jgi:acyl-CoA synthetase (AMP-forming)/AMP-acid ligase II
MRTANSAMGVLRDVFADVLARHRDRVAVGGSHGCLTYRELDEAGTRFAEDFTAWWRSLGGHSGRPRVALYAANSVSYVTAYIGLLRAGAVPFLMDPALGATEVGTLTGTCGLDVFVHDRDLPAGRYTGPVEVGGLRLSRVDPGARPELLDSTEVCRFTSGSTGSPSCIEFSGTAVRNAAEAWHTASGIEAGERVLCFAGLFNGLAFNTSLLPSFVAGAALWLPSGMPSSGHVLRFLTEIRPTRLTGFPALYESLLRRNAVIPELAALRVALSSAAPLRPETAAELWERQGLAVCNYYGVAEAGPLTFDPDPAPDRGMGPPLPGVEFRFDDSREIRVRSGSMGSRYLNAPGLFESKTDSDGFYRTGDEGVLHNGRLHLHGRAGKALNLGGRKIDPAEVRGVLLELGVTDAAVFSVDKRNGDPMLVAVVTGRDGLTESALRAGCLRRLAAYKVPERVLIVDEIPTTGVGKPRISALRELINRTTAHQEAP